MRSQISYLFTTVGLVYLVSQVKCGGLNEEFSWTRIDFDWPSKRSLRQTGRYSSGGGFHGSYGVGSNKAEGEDIYFPSNGDTPSRYGESTEIKDDDDEKKSNVTRGDFPFNFANNIPMGANRWKNKIFITIPRRRPGIPSTLNYVEIDSKTRHNVPLIPYPDWETNLLPSGEDVRPNRNQVKLTSVYRVAVDPCDRLWVIDTGNMEFPAGNATRVQPSQVVIIDLKTDRVLHTHQFKPTDLKPATNLHMVTVDVTKDTCDDAYAYFPDVSAYGLIVYSLKQDKSWRVNHNYFYLESLAGEMDIAGYQFQWNDGTFSVALSDVNQDGFRDVYFHSMAGTHMFKVSTEILKNESLATRSYHGNDFKVVGDRGPKSQTSASVLHIPNSVLFLNLVNQNAVGCWNINRPLTDISLVQKDDNKMIYPSDIKIYDDELIVLTNTMPGFAYGRLNYDAVNFRVWMGKINDVIAGTKCESRENLSY